VDVGIGGATANVVGRKLRELSDNAQVICVTHLAQVASNAHNQLNVVKQAAGDSTQTRIFPLDENSRKTEIARMLSGDTSSEHSLKHAEELLTAARA
ncbi:MAG: DNA repair protein RecN, partial [Pseudomonadales bacterium]